MKKIILLICLSVVALFASAAPVTIQNGKNGYYVVVEKKRVPIPVCLKVSFDDMDSVYWISPETTGDFDIPGGLVWPKLCISETGNATLFLCGEFWKKNGFFNLSGVCIKPQKTPVVSVVPKKIDRKRETFPGNANFYGVESFSVPFPETLLSGPAIKLRIIGENETVDSVVKKKNVDSAAALLNLYLQIKPAVKHE